MKINNQVTNGFNFRREVFEVNPEAMYEYEKTENENYNIQRSRMSDYYYLQDILNGKMFEIETHFDLSKKIVQEKLILTYEMLVKKMPDEQEDDTQPTD